MKKLALTIAIVLGLSMTTFADPNGGGLFNRGENPDMGNNRTEIYPIMPLQHNLYGNQDANESPVGSGIVLLSVLGGAYLVGKKRREE